MTAVVVACSAMWLEGEIFRTGIVFSIYNSNNKNPEELTEFKTTLKKHKQGDTQWHVGDNDKVSHDFPAINRNEYKSSLHHEQKCNICCANTLSWDLLLWNNGIKRKF